MDITNDADVSGRDPEVLAKLKAFEMQSLGRELSSSSDDEGFLGGIEADALMEEDDTFKKRKEEAFCIAEERKQRIWGI